MSTLKKITFGKYLKKVGTGVYYYIEQIPTTVEIYCESLTPPYIDSYENSFTNQQYISNVVYVPQEALEAYSTNVFKVYNLAGVLVKEIADKTEAFDLLSGIYIINGRKVAIR